MSHDDLFPADIEAGHQIQQWCMPCFNAIRPPSRGQCIQCYGSTYWQERSGTRGGWRCYGCIPPSRPDDRLDIIDTRDPVYSQSFA